MHQTSFTTKKLKFFEESCLHYNELLQSGANLLFTSLHDRKVLNLCELGCGTGKLSEILFRTIDVESAILVDIDKNLLSESYRRFATSNQKINFVHSCAEDFLSQNNEKFEVIASSYLLHNLPIEKKKTFLEGIADRLSNSGYFLLIDKIGQYEYTDFESFQNQLKDFANFQKYNPETIDEANYWIQHYIEDESPCLRYSINNLKGLLSTVGLKIKQQGPRWLLDTIVLVEKM